MTKKGLVLIFFYLEPRIAPEPRKEIHKCVLACAGVRKRRKCAVVEVYCLQSVAPSLPLTVACFSWSSLSPPTESQRTQREQREQRADR